MADTPISASIIGRITQAARYVISGVAPDAWFGPLQPLAPIAPPSVAGRRFDYPTGYNLTSLPRSYEPVGFDDLRALADNCDILRSVIETRKDQIEAQEWAIRVKQTDTSARVPVATDDQKRRIDAIMTFLHSPDRQHGFDQWIRQILEDMFVIDGVAIYKRRNRAGGLYALEVMDASTIKILLDDSGRVPQPPDPGYQQVLKGVPAADYTREELMYLVHNPRSHKVYGYSHVEQVIMTVNILIRRSLHQLEYYRDGSVPDALIGTPKEWTAEQIADFQKGFDAMMAGNLAQRRRARFLPGDFKYQEIKAPPLKDAYDEFLARVICFVFSISPEPFVGQVNRATAETSHARAQDEGLAPLMRFVRNLLNRVITCEFASPDLEFAWSETRAQDPSEAAQIDVAYVGAGILTADEVRANMGLAPLPGKSQEAQVIPGAQQPEFGNQKRSSLRGAPASAGAGSATKQSGSLHKDDDNDDSDDDDSVDDSDDSGDEQPRWPAGTPGSIGGQFAPKDEGDATAALHEAISQDAEPSNTNPESLDPDKVWQAIVSAINSQSNLPQGTNVAGDNAVPVVGNIKPQSETEDLVGDEPGAAQIREEEEDKIQPLSPGSLGSANLNTTSAIQNPIDIIAPNGSLIGGPGNGPDVQVMTDGYKGQIGLDGAEQLYNDLTEGQDGMDITPPGYDGTMVELPNGDRIGIRPTTKNGEPAVDTNISSLPNGPVKFKFPTK